MVWQDGQTLQNGKYQIVGEPLGRGGFGITYKARHVRLQEEVVVKTPDKYLKTDPKYSEYIERFIKEGQRLAKLSRNAHHNIVRVRDLFQEGEVHCLVMDFVPGENLFQVVKSRGRLTEAEAISCFQQIGDALATMHEAGLVHRDAHPGNIILRRDGRAILIDFGIAKELVPATMSSTGVAGNEGFAPYEQLFAKGTREPNADVYCLAATLYYAVTGQYPTPSLERRLHDVALIPPQQLVPSISQRLNKAILKGMRLEAKDRPKSMRQWLEGLVVPNEKQPTKQLKEPVLPPPVNPNYRREIIYPTPPSKKSEPRSAKIIPWGSLAGILLLYIIQGWVGAWAGVEVLAWVGGMTLTVTVTSGLTWAEAWAEDWVWLVVWGLGGFLTWTGTVVIAVAEAAAGSWSLAGFLWSVAGAGVWFIAWTLVELWTEGKLQKSFNRFHTFLLLVGTSTLGLGLGWLIHLVLEWFGISLKL
jgi:tRNA A-37 threonylcarbamoyl transferase component Bud32